MPLHPWLVSLLVLSAPALAAPTTAGEAATPSHAVVRVEGMTCSGCAGKVEGALEGLPFVRDTHASFVRGGACLALSGDGDVAAIESAVTDLGYQVTSIELADACPPELRRGARIGPWDGVTGVDAKVISHGDAVDPKDHLVDGHFTVIDFGAPWCGPCHAAAKTLTAYLKTHDDVAVRAIDLDAPDAKASFELPAAEQHLKFVAGIPYLEVYDPRGRRIWKGADVTEAIEAIDARRAR